MNHRYLSACFAIFIVYQTGLPARADFDSGRINFDIGFGNIFINPNSYYSPGAGAIGGLSDIWNSVEGIYQQQPISLSNSAGAPTDVVTEWAFDWQSSSYDSDLSGTYDKLFSSVVHTTSLEIRGLTPGALYDFYLYSSGNGVNYTVAGVNFSAPAVSYPINSLVAGVHYDTHTITASPTGTITFVASIPVLSAWQITPHAVPEPRCLIGCVTIAGLGIVCFTRRGLHRY